MQTRSTCTAANTACGTWAYWNLPQATFGGEFLHADIFEMAAAYLFHILMNHPFIDGNKRTGVLAAMMFLDLNGIEIDAPPGSLHELGIAVATGELGKAKIAEFFRNLAQA